MQEGVEGTTDRHTQNTQDHRPQTTRTNRWGRIQASLRELKDKEATEEKETSTQERKTTNFTGSHLSRPSNTTPNNTTMTTSTTTTTTTTTQEEAGLTHSHSQTDSFIIITRPDRQTDRQTDRPWLLLAACCLLLAACCCRWHTHTLEEGKKVIF